MTTMDPYDLQRFLAAQAINYHDAVGELRNGQKRSHWIWYVFPQLAGLGRSAIAQRYALGTLEEARAYLVHPVLGARLLECTRLMLDQKSRTATQVLGSPDDLKFHSSMTLFALADPQRAEFKVACEKFFSGRRDTATLRLLGN